MTWPTPPLGDSVQALSFEQRAAMIICLQNAALRLWDGVGSAPLGPVFGPICLAVDETYSTSNTKKLVRAWVQAQLGVCAFLGSWLKAEHGVFVHDRQKKYQATRKAWVAAMVAHLEKLNADT